MFKQIEIPKPKYTLRMLLSSIHTSMQGETLSLKPFSHFTLACTLNNEPSVSEKFEDLANYLKGPLTLTASEVINLGTEIKPLWAVRLHLGSEERIKLSSLFDDIMCHELNGVRYFWNPIGEQEIKCPHITIGPNGDDRIKAQKLVDDKYTFTFERLDYKQLGPFEPHVIKELTTQLDSSFTY